MTGLDIDNDSILSLACFVTDADLNLLDEGGYITEVYHDAEALERMGEWCTTTHKGSGLWDRCLQTSVTPDEAAQGCLEYRARYAEVECC